MPTGEGTTTCRFGPFVVGEVPTSVQLVVLITGFSCNTKPVEGNGQKTMTLLLLRVMLNNGAPGVCTAAMRLQKPPSIVKLPPLIVGPASGWPMVPLTEYTPPVLVPPPTVNSNRLSHGDAALIAPPKTAKSLSRSSQGFSGLTTEITSASDFRYLITTILISANKTLA